MLTHDCFRLQSAPCPPQALAAQFPAGAKHAAGARVLLRVTARGRAFAAPGGRWAVGSLRAEEVLSYQPVTPGEKFLVYDDY